MNLSQTFILRPIATSLVMLALLLSGLLAYQMLPISSLPEVDYPTMQVMTFYPGASPEVMTTAVTAPLERQFGQMPGLAQMKSTSSIGASVIVLQFTLDTSLDVAEQEVQESINAASTYLPADLPNPPVYSKVNPADPPILTLSMTSKTLTLPSIEDYAETQFAQQISQQSGVGLVSINGGQRPAVRIQANPMALSAYGLSLEILRSAIANANVNAAKGNFDGPRLAYMINSNDQLLSAEDYGPLIIAYNHGAPVRISDVATVTNGAENTMLAAWKNMEPAIILNIQRQPGANVIDVSDRVQKLLQQLRLTLPNDLKVETLIDRTTTIRASIQDVQMELLLSIALVVLVIFLFLHTVKATIIPSVAIPLAIVGTLGVMYLYGFSLNNLTLMALTIATGFIVDDAIVMIENIARYVEAGETPLSAALMGAKQIGFTILSLTVSLIAVLIPLLFMSDVIGRLFREFAITLSVTILISAFISLTLTPMLSARMLHKQKITDQNKVSQYSSAVFERIAKRYKTSLTWVLAHQPLMLIIFFITMLLTVILFLITPKGFFPIQDTGIIQAISETTPTVSFDEMAKRQQALAKMILQDPDVVNLSSFIGIDGTNMTMNNGRMLISLKPLNNRHARITEIIQRLQKNIKSIPGTTLYLQPVQDLTIDTSVTPLQYQFSVGSPYTEEVNQWATHLITFLKKSPLLQKVTSDYQNNGLETFIQIDRDSASRLGISAQTIDDTLYDAFGQRQVSTIFTQRNQYHVILEALSSLQKNPSALTDLYINSLISNTANTSSPSSTALPSTTSAGGAAPLHVFSHVSQKVSPLVIHRQGQFPVATISFNLGTNASLGEAMNLFNQATQTLQLPASVTASFEGSAKIFQNSLANEGWLVLAAVIVVYIVLGVLYESFIHPITILSTLPSATVGALLALLITGKELTVIALIGIILLIGIVMKNAIMMIDFALEQERTFKKNARDAIYEAAILRFRPILMTTLASMLGALPLAFGGGMGAELRQPLGIAIIGGLLVSQLLTLYSTPVIYLAFDGLAHKLAQIFYRETTASEKNA